MLARRFAFGAICAIGWVGCAPSKPHETVKTDQAAASAPNGFCRSTTCRTGSDFQPHDGMCEPPGWPQKCGEDGKHDVPLWWRSGCVGYSMQKDGGKHVSFDDAANALSSAFLAWTSRACPGDGTGTSRPSIDVRDLGPVACAEVGYNRYGPNQNVIMFRDELWPHKNDEGVDPDKPSPTIALTNVTYDTITGEIYDADMELNTADHDIKPVDGVLEPTAYDLQAVMTHEAGHFFGLAHSPVKDAVMFASDEGHDIRKRSLTQEDVAGICAIYPPSGGRAVSTTVDPSGVVQETPCDPTPRRGFTTACEHTPAPGCGAAPIGARSGSDATFLLVTAGALARLRRRR
jgi:hypothetical protein